MSKISLIISKKSVKDIRLEEQLVLLTFQKTSIVRFLKLGFIFVDSYSSELKSDQKILDLDQFFLQKSVFCWMWKYCPPKVRSRYQKGSFISSSFYGT